MTSRPPGASNGEQEASPAGPAPGRGRGRGRGIAQANNAWPFPMSFPMMPMIPPVARPQPGKNVWRRQEPAPGAAAKPASQKRPREESAPTTQAPTPQPAKRPSVPSAAEQQAAAAARIKEAAELRQKIIDMERKKTEAAKLQEKLAEETARQDRSRKLAAGFASALQRAAEQRSINPEEDSAGRAEASGQNRADEEEKEVARILAAGSDATVLGLGGSFASEDAIRRSYRKIAMRIHPDKSRAPRAADAFHRVKTAYENLLQAKRGGQ